MIIEMEEMLGEPLEDTTVLFETEIAEKQELSSTPQPVIIIQEKETFDTSIEDIQPLTLIMIFFMMIIVLIFLLRGADYERFN